MPRAALNAPSIQVAVAFLNRALTNYISGYRCDDIALLLLHHTGGHQPAILLTSQPRIEQDDLPPRQQPLV